MLNKSCSFFFIKGDVVKFPRPDITLATTIWQFIDFPTDCQSHIVKTSHFYEHWGLSIVGAIKGTHVHIIAPTVNEEMYQ